MRVDSFHPSVFASPPERRRSIQKKYVRHFPTNGLVADLGCGDGVFLELLKDSVRRGIGVDHTEKFITQIREKGLEAVQEDVFDFLRKNQSRFEGVFASHLIEHFPAAKGLELVELIHDALRPGGVALLITPAYHDINVSGERFWLDISHVRPYPLILLREVFLHLGMEVVTWGYDSDTKDSSDIRKGRGFVRDLVTKLLFGPYYNVGDAFMVGRRKTLQV